MNNQKKTSIFLAGFIAFVAVVLGVVGIVSYQSTSAAGIAVQLDISDIATETENAVEISLQGDSANSSSGNVQIDDSTVTIVASGVYHLSGSLEGQIIVDVDDKGVTQLILDNVEIHNEIGSAILVENGNGGVIIQLPDGTKSVLSDGTEYELDDDSEENATLFSKDDLAITGLGELQVEANYNDAITSKDILHLWNANIVVTSVDDGLRGKDELNIIGTQLAVDVEGDGLKSDNDNGEDGNITISSGDISIFAGDDGVHAESELVIDGGFITVYDSYEGLEAANIVINDGIITVFASDDGINIVELGTTAEEGGMGGKMFPMEEGMEEMTEEERMGFRDQMMAQMPENFDPINPEHMDRMDEVLGEAGVDTEMMRDKMDGGFPAENALEGQALIINGGEITVYAGGDGIDSNGSIEIHGGVVTVIGSTNDQRDSAYDTNGEFLVTGGEVWGIGSSSMADVPEQDSSQNAIAFHLDSEYGSSLVQIIDQDDNVIIEFDAEYAFSSVVYSSEIIEEGNTYSLYIDGEKQAELFSATTVSVDGEAPSPMSR